jgi:hypothetical protein
VPRRAYHFVDVNFTSRMPLLSLDLVLERGEQTTTHQGQFHPTHIEIRNIGKLVEDRRVAVEVSAPLRVRAVIQRPNGLHVNRRSHHGARCPWVLVVVQLDTEYSSSCL